MNLAGKKVVVTRRKEQTGEMAALLKAKGAIPILFPTIEILPPQDWGPVDKAIETIGSYQWVVFTSANGVEFFFRRARFLGKDPKRDLEELKICAIGPATAQALEREGLPPPVVPERFIAEEVLEALKTQGIKGCRILLPRAEMGRDVLPQGLLQEGGLADVVIAYRTVTPEIAEEDKKKMLAAHIYTFTSPSTAINFFRIMRDLPLQESLAKSIVASIGPITTQALQGIGIRAKVEAKEYTVAGLIRALEEF
jgi:uroporphyrinogen III methyltransferase/synthase